jgi:DNA polymerase I-like protein with 3'-5' exonuclease and polymerase domains
MRNKAERQGVNFLIQSTSSDIIMNVLCAVDRPLRSDFGARLLITVHDSLVLECPKKYVSQIPDFITEYGVKQVAHKYPWLPVPFSWDVEAGPSYGELHTVTGSEIIAPISDESTDYIDHEIYSELRQEAG